MLSDFRKQSEDMNNSLKKIKLGLKEQDITNTGTRLKDLVILEQLYFLKNLL
jgi:hypothetical protein